MFLYVTFCLEYLTSDDDDFGDDGSPPLERNINAEVQSTDHHNTAATECENEPNSIDARPTSILETHDEFNECTSSLTQTFSHVPDSKGGKAETEIEQNNNIVIPEYKPRKSETEVSCFSTSPNDRQQKISTTTIVGM